MPDENSNTQFRNYYKQLEIIFAIFIDFESNLKRHEKLMNIMLIYQIT